MERNLVLHGKSTLMVSLPAAWLRKQNLAKGDSVEIEDTGENLVVHKRSSKRKLIHRTLDLKDADYLEIRWFLSKMQTDGADVIEVKYRTDEQYMLIHRVVSSIFNFEIFENEKGKCIIKNIVKDIELDPKEITSKIISITKYLFSLTKLILEGKEKGDMEKIRMLRDDAWKFRNALYIKIKHNTIKTSYSELLINQILEQNLSFLGWMIDAFLKCRENPSKSFMLLYDEVVEYFTTSLKKMKKRDSEFLRYMIDTRRSLFAKCQTVAKEGGISAELVIYMTLIIQNIHKPKTSLSDYKTES